jgi:hypothetical protein
VRHFRHNADERRRRLEQAAAQGDHEARAQLFIDDLRMGKPVELIAAEILGTLEVRELQALPGPLVADIRDAATLATHTRIWGEERGGWFPDHTRQDVCPRGHEFGPGVNFSYNEVNINYWSVFAADAESVTVGGMSSSPDGSDEQWLSCDECYAAWPDRNVEWE